jgi:hypothetical protein
VRWPRWERSNVAPHRSPRAVPPRPRRRCCDPPGARHRGRALSVRSPATGPEDAPGHVVVDPVDGSKLPAPPPVLGDLAVRLTPTVRWRWCRTVPPARLHRGARGRAPRRPAATPSGTAKLRSVGDRPVGWTERSSGATCPGSAASRCATWPRVTSTLRRRCPHTPDTWAACSCVAGRRRHRRRRGRRPEVADADARRQLVAAGTTELLGVLRDAVAP